MEGILISKTESICPECLKRIPAEYVEKDGKVYLEKTCPEHGDYRALIWRDAALYQQWRKAAVHADLVSGKHSSLGCPFDCGLCDHHEGKTCTAVMEITYKCNMNCEVCFADTEKVKYDPSTADIRKMYETVWNNAGDCSVQLSGGEPTVRDDLPDILHMGKWFGFSHIQVNSNGIRLAAERNYAALLKEAGADLIYLQFDGVTEDVYQKIRAKKMLDIKKKAIENCAEAGLGVLLVPVIIPGVNDEQIGGIIEFAKEHMPVVRGVHFQPVSYFGRYPARMPSDDVRLGIGDVMEELCKQTGNEMKLEDFVARKRYDSVCAFSSLYYLDDSGVLHSLTHEKRDEGLNLASSHTDFPKKANIFTNQHWRIADHRWITSGSGRQGGNDMKNFIKRVQEYTLSVTGMGFQDAWNIDLGRVRGCCVHVATADGNLTPLCAFHLTDAHGRRLYHTGDNGALCCDFMPDRK